MSVYGICVLFVVGLACVLAERKPPTLEGKCPDIAAFSSLDASKIGGTWYIVQYGRQGIEKMARPGASSKKCVQKNIAATPDKGLSSTTSFISDTKNVSITSTASPTAGKPGVYTVTTDSDDKSAVITILDTDYVNYLVGIYCKSEGDFHGFKIEILSRQKTLDSSLMDKAKAALDTAKISPDLTTVDQNC